MIGYMANSLLPLRVGELVRGTLLAKDARQPVVTVLATVAVERILDLAVVLAIAGSVATVLDLGPGTRTALVTLSTGGFVGLVGLLFLAWNGQRLAAVRSQGKLAKLYSRLTTQLTSGAAALLRPRTVATATAVTATGWTAAVVGTMAYIAAFGLDMPWYGALGVLALVNLGSALPSAPGALGVYHYFAVLALGMWNVDHSQAFAYALVTHALSVRLAVLVGSFALAKRGLSLQQLVPQARRTVEAG